MKKNKELITCCLCNSTIKPDITGYMWGHNAEPLLKGSCCEGCNTAKVIPIRLLQMTSPEEANRIIRNFQLSRQAHLN